MNEPQAKPRFVVDTSVAIKWFLERDEANVAHARQLRELFINGLCTLLAPDFLLVEIANVLTVARRLSLVLVSRALEDVVDIKLDMRELRFSTLVQSVDLASAYGVTVYDSYFLALAIESGSILVTADETFIRKMGRHPAVASLSSLQILQ